MFEVLAKVSCGNITDIPSKLPKLTSEVFLLLEIAIPVLLVIMGTLDLFKSITSNKEDEMAKGRKMFLKRLITAAIVFFIIAITKLIISFLDSDNSTALIDCMDCFISNDCEKYNEDSINNNDSNDISNTNQEIEIISEEQKLEQEKLEQERIERKEREKELFQQQKEEQKQLQQQKEESEKIESDKIGSFTKTYGIIKYFLYVPEGAKKGMPLVIFLHGKGEDGKIEQVKKLAPVTSVVNGLVQGSEQFIFLAPAAPTGKLWLESGKTTWDSLNALIDTISNEYSIDINRLYLTGFSAGGCAVWKLVENFPTKYRAAVPVSCSGDIRTASNFKHTPIYAIAGANETGYVDGMKKSVNKINNAGGNATFKTIPNAGHVQTQSSYSTKELYQWLLSQ